MQALMGKRDPVRGIGSSDIAALCGLSRFKTPIDVYRRVFEGDDQQSSHHIERGRFLEHGIVQWYAHRTGREVLHTDVRAPRGGASTYTAQLDAIADDAGSLVVVEVKSPGRWTERQWGDGDDVPLEYVAQVTWQMVCSGIRAADLVALVDGDIRVYRIDYDEAFAEHLRSVADRFWETHIVTDTPPAADGSGSYDGYLSERYPRDDGAICQVPGGDSLWDDCADLKRLRAERAELDERIAQLEQQIKSSMGPVSGLDIEGLGRITWRERAGSIQWKAAAEAAGVTKEQAEQYRGKSTRAFRCDWVEQ